MKRLLLLIGLFSAAFICFGCKTQDKIIPYSDLPQEAQTFISTHFGDRQVTYVMQDNRSYEVRFTDGTEVEFSKNGEWESIDCEHLQVPQSITSLLPKSIPSYVASHFTDTFICKVEKERRHYTVELNNGLELIFSVSGAFQKIDD